jgi:hypothetical protein
VSLEIENAMMRQNNNTQISMQSETAAPATTEAIKPEAIIKSSLQRSMRTRRVLEDQQQDGDESDGTIDNHENETESENEGEDKTDGEVEELVHGSHQIVGEGVVETKSWVEI